MNKKVSIRVWVIVLFVIVSIGLIIGSYFLSKEINSKQKTDFGVLTKWGVNVIYKGNDQLCTDYHINHKENQNSLVLEADGVFQCPQPGEKKSLDLCDFIGTTDTPLSSDCTGKIEFTVGSFVKDKVFNCPLVFHCGKDKQGKDITIKGQDYIGKKFEFENALTEAVSNNDIVYLPAGSNASTSLDVINQGYYFEFPKELSDMYQDIKHGEMLFYIKIDTKEAN